MRSPPRPNRRIGRLTATACAVAVGALALLALPAAAQQPPDQFPTTGFSLWIDAALAAVVTLIVGGGFVALAPGYTERTTDRVLESPDVTFIYGLGVFVGAVVVIFLLFVTIVGIVLVVPLVIAMVVVGELGYLAAGRAVTDDWGPVLLIAVVVSALASAVPYLGGLVGFVLGCMGAGAWYLDYRDDGSGSGGGTQFDPSNSPGPVGSSTARDVTDEWGSSGSGVGARGASPGTSVDGAEAEPAGGDADGEADADPDDAWTAGFEDELDGE